MYARVTTLEGPPDKIDDGTRHIREQTLPQLQQMDGFEGFVTLADRQSGKQLAVALWESEEALRATEEAVSSQRSGVAEAAGATVAGVERYEVAVFEVPSAGPISGVTDAVGGVRQPVSGVTDTVGGVTGSVSGVTDNLLGGGGGEEEKQR
jgi:heme-degrading monooxygenase HmoA